MAKGINSYVKVKKNTAFGAGASYPTTGMYKIPMTAERFKKIVTRDNSENLSASRAQSSRFTNGKKWTGGMTGDANYTRLDHMIAALLGTPTTSTTDATAKTNLYVPSLTAPLTMDYSVSKGDVPTGKEFRYAGGKGKKFELRWNDRGKVTYDFDCVGYDEVSTATVGSDPTTSDATLNLDLMTCGSQMTVSDIGTGASGAYCIKGGRVTLEQPLSEDDYCNGSDLMGEPDFDGFLQVSGEFLVKFTDRAPYEDYVAQTDLTANIKFVSTVTITGAATTKRTVDILINKFNYNEEDGGVVLVDKPGLLIARVGWTGYGSGGTGATAEPIAIKTINEFDMSTAL